MTENLINLDRNLTVAINSWHSPFLDSVMMFFSDKYFLIPLYVMVFLYIVSRRRFSIRRKEYYNSWKIILVIVLTCLACFAFADNFGHEVIKPYFHRLRPGYDFYTWDLVRTPDGKGGAWSFVSNHAFNIVSFATVITLFAKRGWVSLLVFLVAFMVCYSRVYLARHFLGDVVCGAAAGFITGAIFYMIGAWIIRAMGRKGSIRECR